ncbi:MAG: dihydrolipoyl dehydrogenase [Pseudomonadota bacterium]|nr:dihydrolipoyl dehydrogenase [Pseudomonadota bacterium]
MANQKSVKQIKIQCLVLGSGPGGYTAANRLADLGQEVILVERFDALGGVCLNVGCIPSKAMLHMAEVLFETAELSAKGIEYNKPKIDIVKLRAWKDGIIKNLNQGVKMLTSKRKVKVIHGYGTLTSTHTLNVTDANEQTTEISFEKIILAAGSEPVRLPFLPEDPRIFSSTGALRFADPTGSLLVIGGGIIGCEMATIYKALGAPVTIVEMLPELMSGTDQDLVKPMQQLLEKRGIEIHVDTRVTNVEVTKKGLSVTFEGKKTEKKIFSQILVSVGRKPNGLLIGSDKAGIACDERGFVKVDDQYKTNVDHIFAIGDLIDTPMLAHIAAAEGHLAAEIAAGHDHLVRDFRCYPNVAYTDPEVAWVGETEVSLKKANIKFKKGVFPWMANGRALAMGRSEGLTKILVDPDTGKILGGGVVGKHAGDLIGEIALAIEMGANAEDIALTIHPHPTLIETVGLAAQVVEGTVTDL